MTTISLKKAYRWQQQEMSVIRATSLGVLFFLISQCKQTQTQSQNLQGERNQIKS